MVRPSPRVFLFNTRGALGAGGNPFFALLDVPPSAIEQRITKEKYHSSFIVSFFPHAAAN